MDEINFLSEAKNQERLAAMFADTPWVKIPQVHMALTTERLLVMEFLRGAKLNEPQAFQDLHVDPKIVAQRLSDSMFRQIFEEAFFHADPHPGNILFMADNVVGYVDFGIMLRFSDTLLELFLQWFYAVIYQDLDLFEETFLTVGKPVKALDRIQFRNDLMEYMDEIHFQPANRISFARLFEVMNRIMYRHNISTPSTFLFFFKAISTLEGVARRLDPAFDWRDVWGPRISELIYARYYPKTIIKQYWKTVKDYDRLIVNFPDDYRNLIGQLKDGKLEIQITLPQLQMIMRELQRLLRKLPSAMIMAAIVFGLFHIGRGKSFQDVLDFFENVDKRPLVMIMALILFVLLYFRRG